MSSDIKNRAKFDFVRYANVWEDADILCDALAIKPGQDVLSIASGGDNALALLAEGAKVLAVDLSLAQIACTQLKLIAAKTLPYDTLLEFLGIRECAHRGEMYQQLAGQLDSEVREYWSAHQSQIQAGFIHFGKFEKFFHTFTQKVMPFIHGRKTVEQVLLEKDRQQRHDFYHQRWNNWRWRALFKLFFSRFVMGRLGRDPEFFRYVEGSVADKILSRVEYALVELPTHNNPYLDYILRGNYQQSLPRYLQPEQVEKIKANADGLTLFQGSIEDALNTYPERKFSGYNLSDIFEYLTIEQGQSICHQLIKASSHQARLAYWNMLAPRQFSEQMPEQLRYLAQPSQEGLAKDKAFFYSTFIVEEVSHVGEQ